MAVPKRRSSIQKRRVRNNLPCRLFYTRKFNNLTELLIDKSLLLNEDFGLGKMNNIISSKNIKLQYNK